MYDIRCQMCCFETRFLLTYLFFPIWTFFEYFRLRHISE